MSLTNEIEDSLLACQQIEKELTGIDGEDLVVQEEYPSDSLNINEDIENTEVIEEKVDNEVPLETPGEPEESQAKEPISESVSDQPVSSVTDQHPILKTILSIAVCIFSALVLSLLITNYIAHHTSVEGSSMEPTLSDGDQIIIENISYHLHDPERFDIIVFPTSEGVSYIKRIIGLPGESVWIFDGHIYINGEPLGEDYGNELLEDPGIAASEVKLGDDEYFVLGDNRNASIDSRQVDVGTVHKSDIEGKAWFRFYPLKKMGTIQ